MCAVSQLSSWSSDTGHGQTCCFQAYLDNVCCLKYFLPVTDLCVHEQLVAFRGRWCFSLLKKSSQIWHKDLMKKCDARTTNKYIRTLFNMSVIDKRERYSCDKHIFSHLNKLFLQNILQVIHHPILSF